MAIRAALLALALLAGCTDVAAPPAVAPPTTVSANGTINFAAVVGRVEPVAENLCRARSKAGTKCDFVIYVNPDPKLPPNAFQTRDRSGRPVIGMTISLVNLMRNADELAFVLGHETSHHILGHIDQTIEQAMAGALVGGILATINGGDDQAVEVAQKIGANIGARRFSKEFELQADSFGTIIAFRAGFDAVKGAEFFSRLPDPGNAFLGTHPPNAQRVAIVRQTAAGLQ
jgi:predicted Zn-dependent protease